MVPAVSHHRAERRAAPSVQRRCPADQKGREARWYQVHGIVDPRRAAAEGPVFRIAVADHAVRGIYHLVGKQPRKAADKKPQRRCDHAVGQVFRAGLDRRPGDVALFHRFRLTPDDHADGGAGRPDAFSHGRCHCADMLVE